MLSFGYQRSKFPTREETKMRANTRVKEGFKKRSYPNRKPREPLTYWHIHDPAGRVFLLFNHWIADRMLEGSRAHMIDRDFKGHGLDRIALWEEVKRRL